MKSKRTGLLLPEGRMHTEQFWRAAFLLKRKMSITYLKKVLTLLVGGAALTARVMPRMTFFLATNPSVLRRLREGLERIITDRSRLLEFEELGSYHTW